MLHCTDLSFSYNADKKFKFPDFTVESGKTLLLLGNSGKGKTTLLHLLALILNPEKGEIKLDGKIISNLSPQESLQIRAEKIGIIYQKSHFISSINVLENLLLSNFLANKKQDIKKAKELAKQLGFDDLLLQKTSILSGGEQQRVGIARAMMNNPAIILADEPTSSLDDENCQKVIQLLENQAKTIGASLIIVTHDQRLKNRFSNQIEI